MSMLELSCTNTRTGIVFCCYKIGKSVLRQSWCCSRTNFQTQEIVSSYYSHCPSPCLRASCKIVMGVQRDAAVHKWQDIVHLLWRQTHVAVGAIQTPFNLQHLGHGTCQYRSDQGRLEVIHGREGFLWESRACLEAWLLAVWPSRHWQV